MSRIYVLTTTLKTRDAVEATANHTLRMDLAYDDVLAGIYRKDYWEIHLADNVGSDMESSREDAEMALLIRMADDTRVFVNPNKHVYKVVPLDVIKSEKVSDHVYRIPVSIRNIDGKKGKQAYGTLASMYGMGDSIRMIHGGVIWVLEIRAENIDSAKEIAMKIVTTTHRRSGLLANPHYEIVHLHN